jgi:hypothetical protein
MVYCPGRYKDQRNYNSVISDLLQVLHLIEQMSLEEMGEVVPGVLGEASRADHCRSMTVHLWYHSGQLNFIQTLIGDSDIHWS